MGLQRALCKTLLLCMVARLSKTEGIDDSVLSKASSDIPYQQMWRVVGRPIWSSESLIANARHSLEALVGSNTRESRMLADEALRWKFEGAVGDRWPASSFLVDHLLMSTQPWTFYPVGAQI